jgi:hypothetical protein
MSPILGQTNFGDVLIFAQYEFSHFRPFAGTPGSDAGTACGGVGMYVSARPAYFSMVGGAFVFCGVGLLGLGAFLFGYQQIEVDVCVFWL